MIRNSYISGVGFNLPDKIMKNDELSKYMDTSDEWITERSGIKERRVVEHLEKSGIGPAELAIPAVEDALKMANLNKENIDLIIFSTAMPDYFLPGSGCLLQNKMGFNTIGALDIRVQCSGFVYGLSVAQQYIENGTFNRIITFYEDGKTDYKEIYNNALIDMVNERVEKLKKGDASVSDFTVNSAVDFLHKLSEKGVTLSLASGTDKDDVIAEAKLLGYADLFNGGIFGSVGDVSKYSKKKMIREIMESNDLHGHELVVFGDGPVEIKESRRVDGIAVGIASDEVSGEGLNPEKRTRLIRAGAHYVIPDFSESEALMYVLFKD